MYVAKGENMARIRSLIAFYIFFIICLAFTFAFLLISGLPQDDAASLAFIGTTIMSMVYAILEYTEKHQ